MARSRILFLDAYDSFTNNIVSLLTTLLDADVKVLKIGDPRLNPSSPAFADVWRRELRHFDAVVCGPGPGSPSVTKDVGLMRYVWGLGADDVLPVLGICLGFQSLLCQFGAGIRQLRGGLHGMIREIGSRGLSGEEEGEAVPGDLFRGVEPFKATLYHSLCVDMGQDVVSSLEWPARRWRPFARCPDMIPLAWTDEQRGGGGEVERILMAAKHRDLPFWGLQYHPESVCTDAAGRGVIENWFAEALRWNREHGRATDASSAPLAHFCVSPSHLGSVNMRRKERAVGAPPASDRSATGPTGLSDYGLGCTFAWKTIELPRHVAVPDLVEILGGGANDDDQVILDSSNCNISLPKSAVDVRGRYSVVATDVRRSLQVQYRAGDDRIGVRMPGGTAFEALPLGESYGSFWEFASEFLSRRWLTPPEGHDSPFMGGFMGYVSYEMGLHDLGVSRAEDRGGSRPDVSWVWVTRSLVVDHVSGVVHIQQLRPVDRSARGWERALQVEEQEGEGWIDTVVDRLRSSELWKHAPAVEKDSGAVPTRDTFKGVSFNLPSRTEYMAKVKECQDYIAAGESYELCLTNEVQITIPRSPSASPCKSGAGLNGSGTKGCASPHNTTTPWNLYKSLRRRQPAPFGSYLRLGPTTFLSSSPERFLSCSREGVCFMHPMKGTVKKSDAVRTLSDAERFLRIPKEEAENLMIVDLVRHDLHSVCGPGNVDVPRLMQIEEYASVFQMITVVKGTLPRVSEGGDGYTAIDVLSASLPPGSMTGAPKKRSCEILRGVEGGRERGVYSGVTGYVDVSGKADWSVNIRCLFRYDDECAPGCRGGDCEAGECEAGGVWHVGAGGAVTTLSTPEGECEEMFTKLEGSLGLFGGV
ncbi:related to para-aminobenzoic acid synthetase [Cephalotrichum gorgonifer]|uniref:aminodeoxychorismate synthase n=1 Tax=Cephalotrichum gorgonifer TaxID=2041049 RepID=A0AAE8SU30_9PEZI|nr:related to para-aminobenzoic acid synthetase [Cephalotrichum gorgonifer]